MIGYKNNTKKEWISEKTCKEITGWEKINGRINVSRTRKQTANLQVEYWNAIKNFNMFHIPCINETCKMCK